MKSFYNFERTCPPPLTERRLRAEAERRRLYKQMALLVVSALLIEVCLLLSTLLLVAEGSRLAVFSGLYLIISLTGGSALTIVFIQKRRELIQ